MRTKRNMRSAFDSTDCSVSVKIIVFHKFRMSFNSTVASKNSFFFFLTGKQLPVQLTTASSNLVSLPVSTEFTNPF